MSLSPRRTLYATVWVFVALSCTSNLVRNDLEGRGCPCLPGWECDEPTQICLRAEDTSDAGMDSNVGGSSTGASDAAFGGEMQEGDGGPSATLAGGGGAGGCVAPNTECGEMCCRANEACTDEKCVLDCGIDPVAPGAADCPDVCDSCDDNVCVIDCVDAATCPKQIDCPPDFACKINCTGADSCMDARVECPSVYPCGVWCSSQTGCNGTTIVCSDGPCELHCSEDRGTCKDANLICGENRCEATCASPNFDPDVTGCATSCSDQCACQ